MQKKLRLGVTGHRKLLNIDSLKDLLYAELMNLLKEYKFESIISPLADGADRVVATMLMDEFDVDLIIPLPFEKNEYKKDFSSISKKEFDTFLHQSSKIYEVSNLGEMSREECYFNVGKEVVNQCNILIALWDGKPADGLGGTGDVVSYATDQGKAVLHIHIETLVVNKINFQRIESGSN